MFHTFIDWLVFLFSVPEGHDGGNITLDSEASKL